MHTTIDIVDDDLTGEETRALLALHLSGMRENSPPGSCFVLDLSGLRQPGIAVWTARIGGRVAGIAALRDLGVSGLEVGVGELKSMRTHPDHLRRGVAGALLEHVIATARARGLRRLSLETGSGPAFEPALELYRRRGFVEGSAFGDYVASAFNRFFHLEL